VPDAAPITTTTTPVVPGAVLLARVRRLVMWAFGAGLAYSFLASGTMSGCAGGGSEPVQACVSATLRAGPALYLALLVVIAWTVGAAIDARDADDAKKRIDRGILAVQVIVVASLVVAHVGFWTQQPLDLQRPGIDHISLVVAEIDVSTY